MAIPLCSSLFQLAGFQPPGAGDRTGRPSHVRGRRLIPPSSHLSHSSSPGSDVRVSLSLADKPDGIFKEKRSMQAKLCTCLTQWHGIGPCWGRISVVDVGEDTDAKDMYDIVSVLENLTEC